MRISLLTVGALMGLLAATGCGPRLRPVAQEPQQIGKQHTACITQQGVEVTLRQVETPNPFGDGMVSVEVSVVNHSDVPVRLSYPHAYLVDPQGIRYGASDPNWLLRVMSRGHAGSGPGRVTFGDQSGYNFDPLYDDYVVYEWQWQMAMRFVARLWDDRLISPGATERGSFVFDYRPCRGEAVRFDVDIARWVDEQGNPLPRQVADPYDYYDAPVISYGFGFRNR